MDHVGAPVRVASILLAHARANSLVYMPSSFGLCLPQSACMWAKLLLLLKGIVLFYWLWVARVLIFGNPSGFGAVVAMTAPLFLSFHFVQALVLLRRIKSEQPFWLQLTQTLAFGALYLAPLFLAQQSGPRAPGGRARQT
jgi:hypothetical protein